MHVPPAIGAAHSPHVMAETRQTSVCSACRSAPRPLHMVPEATCVESAVDTCVTVRVSLA